MVRWTVVLRQRVGHGVLANETDVFVILTRLGVIWQEVGDGVVAAALRVSGDVHDVRGFGGTKGGDGRFLVNEVRTEFPGDFVICAPNTYLQGIGTGGGKNVVDGVVIEPRQRGLAGGGVKLG